MTKREYDKCIRLMDDAIIHAKRSENNYFEIAEKQLSDIDKNIKELDGQYNLGYARGVNQVLAYLGFKHDRMSELQKLI